MKLVWKLLRQHISLVQFVGFTLANLVGLLIILLGLQFYQDVQSIFSSRESFMKQDYLVVTKQVHTSSTLTGQSMAFTQNEVDDLQQQPFTQSVGQFTPADFKVYCQMGMEGLGIQFGTDMFFESVPDRYVDYDSDQWTFTPGDELIPIILPRNYLNLYNFGFAQTRGLPKMSESAISMITLDIRISGIQQQGQFKAKIVGFSNRLNTILVPQTFMDWANQQYGSGQPVQPSRLILEVYKPTDDAIARYFQKQEFETENDKLQQGRTTWFLKLMVGGIMAVGVLISALALYILMLSIYLLVQKNSTKLEHLLLIGYSPRQVASPYQLLTLGLNALVLVLVFACLVVIRNWYLQFLEALYPDLLIQGISITLWCGCGLFVVVSLLNVLVIKQKISHIWNRK